MPNVFADFSKSVFSLASTREWVASPMVGVERQFLDRVGDEVARATSLVRYAPGSRFSPHVHDAGEEYYVLSGRFSDDSGDHDEGAYVRNPPGTSHAPYSVDGCTIFVKLRQFANDDTEQFVVDTKDARAWKDAEDGISRCALHHFSGVTSREEVVIERWPAATKDHSMEFSDGGEIFVLDGSVQDVDGVLTKSGGEIARHGWMRIAPGCTLRLSSTMGATIWMKSGHLPR